MGKDPRKTETSGLVRAVRSRAPRCRLSTFMKHEVTKTVDAFDRRRASAAGMAKRNDTSDYDASGTLRDRLARGVSPKLIHGSR